MPNEIAIWQKGKKKKKTTKKQHAQFGTRFYYANFTFANDASQFHDPLIDRKERKGKKEKYARQEKLRRQQTFRV